MGKYIEKPAVERAERLSQPGRNDITDIKESRGRTDRDECGMLGYNGFSDEELAGVIVEEKDNGLANKEAADILSISLPAVKSGIRRSRFFLRYKLSNYSFHDERNNFHSSFDTGHRGI